jgi:hypothetical protein
MVVAFRLSEAESSAQTLFSAKLLKLQGKGEFARFPTAVRQEFPRTIVASMRTGKRSRICGYVDMCKESIDIQIRGV